MKWTVAIPNYNYGKYLRRCIDSCLEQGAEVIVTDNVSEDDSRDILLSYGGDITTVFAHENTGAPTEGYNNGIELAHGDWLIFLDADDYLAPGALKVFEQYTQDADWLPCDMNLVDDDGSYMGRYEYAGWPDDLQSATDFMYDPNKGGGGLPVPMKGAFRLSWLRENNLRRIQWSRQVHSDDSASCWEWLQHSPRIRYVPVPLVWYRYRRDSLPEVFRYVLASELSDILKDLSDKGLVTLGGKR